MNNPEDLLKQGVRPLAQKIVNGERDDPEAGKELAKMFLQLDKWLREGERIPVDWPGFR